MSISERLQKELKDQKPAWTTRKFQIAVEKEAGEGARGTSYASVYEYVEGKGRTEPPLSFLRPAARVLGVSPRWLAFGGRYRTLEEEAAGAVADSGGASGDDSNLTASRADLEKAFLEGLPALSAAGPASWHTIGDLYSQYSSARIEDILGPGMREGMELVASGKDHDPVAYKQVTQRAQIAAARRVAELVGAAAKAADVDLLKLSRWGLDRYIQITSQALSVLFGPAGPLRRGRQLDRKKAEKEIEDAQE